ncbi:MAG TPA: hypothetical protein PKY56_02345 [Candidatus Kapabacteria bacterium]|nr:hypothetical protein [Candidatus Kapabacteria bacterium]HPO61704.1 hypothetical protein [Candidatus Kapabacteria bacterium]
MQKNIFKIISVCLLALALFSCSDSNSSEPSSLIYNQWQRHIVENDTLQFDGTITFNKNSTFNFVINDTVKGHINTTSDFELLPGNKMKFFSDNECQNEAVYNYTFTNNNTTLVLQSVVEDCHVRMFVLEGEWTLLPQPQPDK